MSAAPSIVILAGPNGAGKTTAAGTLLRDTLGIRTFVNADVIAQELSPGRPCLAAFEAGRRMLARLEELTARRATFALETTLSGRAYAPWLRRCMERGYAVHLIFLWLPSADEAIERVAQRVLAGGHGIPEEVIRRRYALGLRNFFGLYCHLCSSWAMYDNSGEAPRRVADGVTETVREVADSAVWSRLRQEASPEA